MIRPVAIGAAFAAVLLVLLAAVTLPVWLHPVNEDQARELAHKQPGLASYSITQTRLVVSLDGRVRDGNGFVLYTAPGPKLEVGGVSAAPPAAYWIVNLQAPQRRCAGATVVVDAGSHDVVLVARHSRRCSEF